MSRPSGTTKEMLEEWENGDCEKSETGYLSSEPEQNVLVVGAEGVLKMALPLCDDNQEIQGYFVSA
jgi:hypothetical protein